MHSGWTFTSWRKTPPRNVWFLGETGAGRFHRLEMFCDQHANICKLYASVPWLVVRLLCILGWFANLPKFQQLWDLSSRAGLESLDRFAWESYTLQTSKMRWFHMIHSYSSLGWPFCFATSQFQVEAPSAADEIQLQAQNRPWDSSWFILFGWSY